MRRNAKKSHDRHDVVVVVISVVIVVITKLKVTKKKLKVTKLKVTKKLFFGKPIYDFQYVGNVHKRSVLEDKTRY